MHMSLKKHGSHVSSGDPQLLCRHPPSTRALLERLFKTAAAFLEEGSLEARTYGKRLIWAAKGCVSNRSDYDRLVASLRPEGIQKKVVETIEGSNGPPPPPARQALGALRTGY